MIVTLVSVGTEIVIGDILNTNAQYLAKNLADLGLNVYKHVSVGDNEKRLLKTIIELYEESDILIFTGGLGPTEDDITKEVVAKYFNLNLLLDEKLNSFITSYDKKYNYENEDVKRISKQAFIPEGAKIINNNVGTAPGIIIEKNNKIAILMPGPPMEMKNIFENGIKNFLAKFSNNIFHSKYIRFYGIGEERLENEIKDIIEKQTNPSLALYAKPGEVLIRVTSNTSKELIDEKIDEIKKIVGEYIYDITDTIDDKPRLDKVVSDIILNKKVKINIFETVTLGNFTTRLIQNKNMEQLLNKSTIDLNLDYNKVISTINKDEDSLNVIIYGNKNMDNNLPTTSNSFKIFIKYKNKTVNKEVSFNGVKSMLQNKICLETFNEIRKILM